MSLRPTINDPVEGMIENTGRYTKKIGGKRYLVYLETIARQVKLDDGRDLQNVADTVDDYFRLSKEYVAQLAEAAKQSEDNAKDSELAAKVSENAAHASEVAAAASQRAAAASEQHCGEIAADVDAAIERAAYEQITERVVPTVINEARDQAVDILVPEITDRLEQDLNARLDSSFEAFSENFNAEAAEKFAEQDARLDYFNEALDEERIAFGKRFSDLSLVTARHEQIIHEDEIKHDRDIADVNERIDSTKAELDEKIDATKSELEDRISANDLQDARQHSFFSKQIAQNIVEADELRQRFDEHQLNDTERFSNLSYASVVHTRKILEITEEATAELVNRLVCTSRMCLLHIMDYLDGVKDYIASISSHGVDQHVQPDGTTTTANQMNFVGDDGTVVPLTALTLNRS